VSDSNDSSPEPPLSRAEKVELFSEESVQRQEWSSGERELIDEVLEELRAVIDERGDTRVARTGSSFSSDGLHEVRLTVEIAGNAWVGPTDDSEGDG